MTHHASSNPPKTVTMGNGTLPMLAVLENGRLAGIVTQFLERSESHKLSATRKGINFSVKGGLVEAIKRERELLHFLYDVTLKLHRSVVEMENARVAMNKILAEYGLEEIGYPKGAFESQFDLDAMDANQKQLRKNAILTKDLSTLFKKQHTELDFRQDISKLREILQEIHLGVHQYRQNLVKIIDCAKRIFAQMNDVLPKIESNPVLVDCSQSDIETLNQFSNCCRSSLHGRIVPVILNNLSSIQNPLFGALESLQARSEVITHNSREITAAERDKELKRNIGFLEFFADALKEVASKEKMLVEDRLKFMRESINIEERVRLNRLVRFAVSTNQDQTLKKLQEFFNYCLNTLKMKSEDFADLNKKLVEQEKNGKPSEFSKLWLENYYKHCQERGLYLEMFQLCEVSYPMILNVDLSKLIAAKPELFESTKNAFMRVRFIIAKYTKANPAEKREIQAAAFAELSEKAVFEQIKDYSFTRLIQLFIKDNWADTKQINLFLQVVDKIENKKMVKWINACLVDQVAQSISTTRDIKWLDLLAGFFNERQFDKKFNHHFKELIENLSNIVSLENFQRFAFSLKSPKLKICALVALAKAHPHRIEIFQTLFEIYRALSAEDRKGVFVDWVKFVSLFSETLDEENYTGYIKLIAENFPENGLALLKSRQFNFFENFIMKCELQDNSEAALAMVGLLTKNFEQEDILFQVRILNLVMQRFNSVSKHQKNPEAILKELHGLTDGHPILEARIKYHLIPSYLSLGKTEEAFNAFNNLVKLNLPKELLPNHEELQKTLLQLFSKIPFEEQKRRLMELASNEKMQPLFQFLPTLCESVFKVNGEQLVPFLRSASHLPQFKAMQADLCINLLVFFFEKKNNKVMHQIFQYFLELDAVHCNLLFQHCDRIIEALGKTNEFQEITSKLIQRLFSALNDAGFASFFSQALKKQDENELFLCIEFIHKVKDPIRKLALFKVVEPNISKLKLIKRCAEQVELLQLTVCQSLPPQESMQLILNAVRRGDFKFVGQFFQIDLGILTNQDVRQMSDLYELAMRSPKDCLEKYKASLLFVLFERQVKPVAALVRAIANNFEHLSKEERNKFVAILKRYEPQDLAVILEHVQGIYLMYRHDLTTMFARALEHLICKEKNPEAVLKQLSPAVDKIPEWKACLNFSLFIYYSKNNNLRPEPARQFFKDPKEYEIFFRLVLAKFSEYEQMIAEGFNGIFYEAVLKKKMKEGDTVGVLKILEMAKDFDQNNISLFFLYINPLMKELEKEKNPALHNALYELRKQAVAKMAPENFKIFVKFCWEYKLKGALTHFNGMDRLKFQELFASLKGLFIENEKDREALSEMLFLCKLQAKNQTACLQYTLDNDIKMITKLVNELLEASHFNQFVQHMLDLCFFKVTDKVVWEWAQKLLKKHKTYFGYVKILQHNAANKVVVQNTMDDIIKNLPKEHKEAAQKIVHGVDASNVDFVVQQLDALAFPKK